MSLLAAGCQYISCGVATRQSLTLAAGPHESAAACVARVFTANLNEQSPEAHAGVLGTNGAVDSLLALGDGRADLAITTADALALAVNGEGPFERRTVSARTIATLYTSRLYLMVPAASGLVGFSQLRDRTIGVGPSGSGMGLTMARALRGALLDQRVSTNSVPWPELLAGLDAGALAAIGWVDGLPSAAVAGAARRAGRRLRFLSSGSVVPFLQRAYGASLYEQADIPAGSYGASDATSAVGVSTVLVARHDLREDAAFSVTRALFRFSGPLARACPAAGTLNTRSATRPEPAALHAGAARFYRENSSEPLR